MPKPDSGQTPPPTNAQSADLPARISRRGFAGKAAAIAATPFASVSWLLGASCGSPEQAASSKSEVNLGLTADQAREAEAKLANAIRQFGDRLSEEQRGRLRRILLYNEKMLVSIRSFHIENGDAPASVLSYFDVEIGAPEQPNLHPSRNPSRGVEKHG